MKNIDFVVRAATVAAAIALWVPIVHKLRLVTAGEAALDPVVGTRPWLARRPSLWVLAAVAVESCISIALVAIPAAGCVAFALLCVGYSSQLAFLAAEEECECFGRAAGGTKRNAAIRRNATLAVLAAVAGAGYASGMVDDVSIAQASGAAAVILSPLAAWMLLRSLREPRSLPARGGR